VTARPYIVGLGSNLGSRRANLEAGLELLELRAGCWVGRVSSVYESDPLGPPQPRYFNAAVALESTLDPHSLLAALLEIEALLGRQRGERWGARTLDLDILWAREPMSDETLCVPHPRLRERAFALAPLLEVAPELTLQYGDALHALGGPSCSLGSLRGGPQAQSASAGHELQVSVTAHDLADAAAAVLTELGVMLAHETVGIAPEAPCAGSEVQVVLANPASGRELAQFVELALSHAHGFAIQRATVCALAPGHCEGRLVGRRRPTLGPELSLLEVSHETIASGTRVVLRVGQALHPGTEVLAFSREILDR
jgi:2-amino-4-hydroxy-6-hydroxymethyldihydropteridine diphosphokinase